MKLLTTICVVTMVLVFVDLIYTIANGRRIRNMLGPRIADLQGAREHAAGIVEGRQAGIDERAGRVAESERVEDRTAKAAARTEMDGR